jgi:hypothetical protein
VSCPNCGCKVTYPYDIGYDGEYNYDYGYERCSACGHVFYVEDSIDDED